LDKIQINGLDFGGKPDLDPDPGIFSRNINYHCSIGNNKGLLALGSTTVRKYVDYNWPQIELIKVFWFDL